MVSQRAARSPWPGVRAGTPCGRSAMRRVHSLPIHLLGNSPALAGPPNRPQPLLSTPPSATDDDSPPPSSSSLSSSAYCSCCPPASGDTADDKENFYFKKPLPPLRLNHLGHGQRDARRHTSAPALMVQPVPEDNHAEEDVDDEEQVARSAAARGQCRRSSAAAAAASPAEGAAAAGDAGEAPSAVDVGDDGFLEFPCSPGKDTEAMVVDSPRGICTLINAPLVSHTLSHTPTGSRHRRQRCLFRSPSTPSMGSSRAAWAAGVAPDVRAVPFAEKQQQQQEAVQAVQAVQAVRCKRAERTPGGTPGRSKRHRGDGGGGGGGGDGEEPERGGGASSVRRKSMSACDDITLLLEVSPDRSLIGDFTRPHVLPLVSGKDESLKYVSADTLSLLLTGEFSDAVERFLVIDCRYPYEFHGGHIKGAVNVVTEGDALSQLLVSPLHPSEPRKRVVLVFHCEFSSERGPRMCRFVRSSDRNGNPYPRLHYPELYVLHGGYRAFYPTHTALCEPQAYVPMLHEDFRAELRHSRQRSRSWAGERSRSHMSNRLQQQQQQEAGQRSAPPAAPAAPAAAPAAPAAAAAPVAPAAAGAR
ncbi:M-phase inducer phosphatase 2-like [Petromyzon marinus]|uniref:M-phase inducer phosphatase 2-like n=1 Tax=Petromyzon marinus TaxID=7757 RepID=UPI003F6F2397